jgi:hypothetical protein
MLPPDDDDDPDPLIPPDEPELPEAFWPELPSPDPACPSPCDELLRSRLELLDDPLMPPLLPEEPEVFWLRSAMLLSS